MQPAHASEYYTLNIWTNTVQNFSYDDACDVNLFMYTATLLSA